MARRYAVRSAMRAFCGQVRYCVCVSLRTLTYDAIGFFQELVKSVDRVAM
jgi:hypothetical protein